MSENDDPIYTEEELAKESALAYDAGFEDGYNEGWQDAVRDVDMDSANHD